MLFRYWDGVRFVRADPFVLMRRLLTSGEFDPDSDLKKLELPDPKLVVKTLENISSAVRNIFDIPQFQDGGLSELECVNLLKTFIEWADQLKKNGATKQISHTSTPVAVNTDGSAPETPMREPSDSIATESES